MTACTFCEVSLFLKMMSRAMARRPDWVEQVAANMDGVADIRKDQVLELNAQVHSAARKRAIDQILRSEAGHDGSREASDKAGTTRVTSAERAPSRRRDLPRVPRRPP